jgi:ubiquitin-protein ligase E3 A
MYVEDEETRQVFFNSFSLESDRQFQLTGLILGLAIYNGVILDLHFPSLVYKKLLGQKPTFQDLQQFKPTLARGLQQLLEFEGDVQDTFCLIFQVETEVYGHRETYDLKPDGENIPVTNENRQEYVDLYTKYLLEDSVERQFAAFEQGFHAVCGSPVLYQLCRAEELEQLICGSSEELDFEELERITLYLDGYSPRHPLIRHFWEIVHGFTQQQKRNLLAFVTGSDRVPIKGISRLTFIIQRNGPDTDRLPTAFTCFSRLLLPEYSTKEKLERLLITAIDNARGFGLC